MKPPTCFRCDYPLTGLPDVGACPECGETYGDALEVKAAMRGARGYGWKVIGVQMGSIALGLLLYIIATVFIRRAFGMTDWFLPAMVIGLILFFVWMLASIFLVPRWAKPLENVDRSFDVRLRMEDEGIVIASRSDGARRSLIQWEKVTNPVVRPHGKTANEYEFDFRMRVFDSLPFRLRIIYIVQADEAIARTVEVFAKMRIEEKKAPGIGH